MKTLIALVFISYSLLLTLQVQAENKVAVPSSIKGQLFLNDIQRLIVEDRKRKQLGTHKYVSLVPQVDEQTQKHLAKKKAKLAEQKKKKQQGPKKFSVSAIIEAPSGKKQARVNDKFYPAKTDNKDRVKLNVDKRSVAVPVGETYDRKAKKTLPTYQVEEQEIKTANLPKNVKSSSGSKEEGAKKEKSSKHDTSSPLGVLKAVKQLNDQI